ncbi:MAG: glycerophosphodiester phosphodiesterase, partial [bacterium]
GNKKERLLIAHMGYSSKCPENTIPAFEAAGKDSRYFAIETDLHDTKDGKIVCMHGFKVEERTDGTGRISDLTLDEIRALTITYGNGLSNYAETPLQIPTFEEYLAICKQYHKIAFVEIKALAKQSNLKVIYETLKAYDMLDRCILTSGKTSQLETFREKYDSDIPIAPLLSADMTDAKLTKWSRMDDVMIYLEHPKVTKDDVRIARLLNLEYGSYTLSTSSLIQKLLSYDVYMLCVNRPDL